MFTKLSIRLPTESLEQIDDAIERFHTALTNRQEFVELAVEYAIANLKEEAESLGLGSRTSDEYTH